MELGYKTLNQTPEITNMDMLRGVLVIAGVAALVFSVILAVYHAVLAVAGLVQIIGQVIGF